ncbi:MAG: radical SAM protein [Cytophagales bacterium]|nr:MAG: radical SAM protein [Cytophagales bacterium]
MRQAQITDTLNLLSKLSLKKSGNFLSVLASYYLSKYFKKLIYNGLPISIAIEPTTSCNLRCPECPSGLRSFTRPTGMLQEETFKKVIDELESTLLYLTFYFQGEPYLHPKFTELVHYASQKGIYTSTSTNAHYLTEENAKKTVLSGLDRLIISIDGTSQETYQAYRIGGKLEKVIEGTKNILYWKKQLNSKTPYVIFQFLVVKPNEHEIEEVQRIGKEIGVDEVKLKTAQIYDYENGSPLLPSIEKYARYQKGKDGKYFIKNSLENSCWRMWQSCVITWDGGVVPCCFDKDAHHKLGELANDSFKAIWKSENYQNFRKSLLRSRSEIEMCKNCTEGTKVFS